MIVGAVSFFDKSIEEEDNDINSFKKRGRQSIQLISTALPRKRPEKGKLERRLMEMSTSTQRTTSESSYVGENVLRRGPLPGIITANLFREVSKVKNLRKPKTNAGGEEEILDIAVTDELVADHEWESMLHTFEAETDELSPGSGGAESEDLWERLSSTRWLKSGAPQDDLNDASLGSSDSASSGLASSSSETRTQ